MNKNDPANIDFIFNDDETTKELDPRAGKFETNSPMGMGTDPTRELWVGFHFSGEDDNPQMGIEFNVKDNDNPIEDEKSFEAIDELLALANNTILTEMFAQDWEMGMTALTERIHLLYHNQETEAKGQHLLDSIIKAVEGLKKSH